MHVDQEFKRLASFFGAVGLIAMLVAGCQADNTPGAEPQALATVGEKHVTVEEFQAYLKFKKIAVRSEKHFDELLKTYVEREAMAQAIEKSAMLDKAMSEAEANAFRKEMLISRYFDRHQRTSVTQQDVEQYFKDHAEEYETHRVHIAHILMRVPNNSSEAERTQKRAKIDEALRRLDAGEPFAQVAKELSEDRVSANRGGDMGWVRKGTISTGFSKAAFALEKDEYSKPIQTSFGFHIVTALEAAKTQKRPLSAVEGDIRYKLRAKAKKTEVVRLMDAVPVEINSNVWTPRFETVTSQHQPSKED